MEYLGNHPEYAPLGKAISEMMITDLSQDPELMLIERVRLQALLEAIALGQRGIMEETSAHRRENCSWKLRYRYLSI